MLSVHFLFDNALQEFAPFHFFHDHVGHVVCLKDVMKTNNVRTTTKELQGFNLILESTLSTTRYFRANNYFTGMPFGDFYLLGELVRVQM